MNTHTSDLLQRFETIRHIDRVREMVQLGQNQATDKRASDILADLQNGGTYERFMALQAVYGNRDGAIVLRALEDESRLLRGFAMRLVSLACTDEQAAVALQTVSPKKRLMLLRNLRHVNRSSAIDRYARTLIDGAEADWSELLSFCSLAFVRELLPRVVERFSADDWRRLARTHPDLATETLTERLDQQTDHDARLLWCLNAVLSRLCESRPQSALALVRKALRHESPSSLSLNRLAERLPNDIADLLLSIPDRFSLSFGSAVRRLTEDRLLALLEKRPESLGNPLEYLPHLAPMLRDKAYTLVGNAWRTPDGILSETIVALLSRALREAEARRHLTLPILQTRLSHRLRYAAYLPPDEAQTVLEPFIRNPDADLRSVALAARIGTARFYPTRLGDVLRLVRARNKEQDPVRQSMLSAIADLPPSRWQSEHLEELGQIIRDALDASDLSVATASEAERLVFALVPFHPGWAAQWFGTLAKERGQIGFHRLRDRLTDTDVKRIAPALLPVLATWETREREGYLLSAARGFGRRLRVFDGLATILGRVAQSTKNRYVAEGIVSLFQEHLPLRFAALVPDMIDADKSAATLPVIYDYLHRQRQDLITPFLGQQAYSGRFSTGRTRFVLPVQDGFHRWTRQQQETFAQTLERITEDKERDTPAVGGIIRQLAAMPAVEPKKLIALAQQEGAKTAVRDLALQSLARLDAGQGIPVLVAALDDDRARIAIYALRSAITEMPTERAMALLQNAPTTKVTVAKEILRLVGDLHTPTALPFLLAKAKEPLHRDVRVALLRALWEHIETEETWEWLNAAATDVDPAIASGVVRIPAERLSPVAAGRLRNLLAMLLTHPDPKVRLDTLNRCAVLPLADPKRVLLPHLLTRLASPLPDENIAAAHAVFATYAQRDAIAIGESILQILPNRRASLAVLPLFKQYAREKTTQVRDTTRAVLTALANDPLTSRYRVEIAIAGLAGQELVSFFVQLAEKGELHADALMAAVSAVEARQATASEQEIIENGLRENTDERLRRIAFAAFIARARIQGWDSARRERHAQYCTDTSALVAAAAQFTALPPDEATTQVG